MTIRSLKIIAAILLIVSIFLPFSKGGLFSFSTNPPVHHSFDMLNGNSPANLLVILAFTWPLLLMVFRRTSSRRRVIVQKTLEALLPCGSAYILIVLATFETPIIGWYSAQAGNALYLLGMILELVHKQLAVKRAQGNMCLS